MDNLYINDNLLFFNRSNQISIFSFLNKFIIDLLILYELCLWVLRRNMNIDLIGLIWMNFKKYYTFFTGSLRYCCHLISQLNLIHLLRLKFFQAILKIIPGFAYHMINIGKSRTSCYLYSEFLCAINLEITILRFIRFMNWEAIKHKLLYQSLIRDKLDTKLTIQKCLS